VLKGEEVQRLEGTEEVESREGREDESSDSEGFYGCV
jgi:hypothetical protein